MLVALEDRDEASEIEYIIRWYVNTLGDIAEVQGLVDVLRNMPINLIISATKSMRAIVSERRA